MRRLTAVVAAMAFVVAACGDDDGGSVETVTAGETPPDLRNLWEQNMEPDAELVVLDTPEGPMYLLESERFAFGTCAANDALEDKDPMVSYVCNP